MLAIPYAFVNLVRLQFLIDVPMLSVAKVCPRGVWGKVNYYLMISAQHFPVVSVVAGHAVSLYISHSK